LFSTSSGSVRVIDLSDKYNIQNIDIQRKIVNAEFSPDLKAILFVTADSSIVTWDMLQNKILNTIHNRDGDFLNITFFHNGNNFITASSNVGFEILDKNSNRINETSGVKFDIWSYKDSKLIKSLNQFSGSAFYHSPVLRLQLNDNYLFTNCAFFGDSLSKVSGGVHGGVICFNILNGSPIRFYESNGPFTTSLDLCPDGKEIATGGRDGIIWLYDSFSAKLIKSFRGHENEITSISFSTDGKKIVSGSKDKTIIIWDVEKGSIIKKIKGHDSYVNSVSISQNSKYIVSGSQDQTIKLWDGANVKEIITIIPLDSTDWVVKTPDGRFDCSQGGMKKLYYVQGQDILPLESFFEKFYTPGLLSQIISGTLPSPEQTGVDFSKPIKLPPSVTIISPQPGGISSTSQILLKAEVTDQGGGINEVRLSQNGKIIIELIKSTQLLPSGDIYFFNISLVSGDNLLKITAFNNDRTESSPAEVIIHYEAPKPQFDLYIFAIGLNRYKNPNYTLQFARPDAEAFIQTIKNRTTGIFRNIFIQTLYDDKATLENITLALSEIQRKARPEDIFIFYYSGHGDMVEKIPGYQEDFYFILHDVEKIAGSALQVHQKAFSAASLKGFCRDIKAQKQLVVIDACMAGGALESFAYNRGPSQEKAIYQLARSTGVFVLAASSKDQTAKEFPSLNHGLFTYTLLQGLNCDPEVIDKEGLVWIKPLETFIEKKMDEYTQKYGTTPQRPMSWTYQNDFPVAVCK